MEGVRSFATRTVPGGRSRRGTSSMFMSIFRRLILISRTSAARCCMSSSSILENIPMNISETASTADSAHCPAAIIFNISPDMVGSSIMTKWSSRISASSSPIRFRISSAISLVFFVNLSKDAVKRLCSASVSCTITGLYCKSCSSMI